MSTSVLKRRRAQQAEAKAQRCMVTMVRRSEVSKRAVGSKRPMELTKRGASQNPSMTLQEASTSAVEPPSRVSGDTTLP